MAKKKQELLARVSYNPGTGNPKDFYGDESYVIETYDTDDKEWYFTSNYRLGHCAESPEVKEATVVSYNIIEEIFMLMRQGYKVTHAGRIERGHDVNG